MHSPAIGTGHATSTRGTAQPQLATDKVYLERLKTLVAPKRSFKQRLGDWIVGRQRHALGNSQLAYMGWVHGRIRESGAQRAEAAKQNPDLKRDGGFTLGNFVSRLFTTREDASRDPHALAQRIAQQVGQNPREARAVLEACSFDDFSEQVRAKIGEYWTLGDQELTVLVDVAFAAVISAVATADESSQGGARKEIEDAFSRHAEAETPEQQSASIRDIEQRLGLAVLLSPEAKTAYVKRLEALHKPKPDVESETRSTIAQAMEGIKLDHDAADLENRLFLLSSIIARLHSPSDGLSDKQREALRAHASERQAELVALQSRTAHIAALQSSAPQLHRLFKALETPQAYVEARRSLEHIVRTLGGPAETHVLSLLDTRIRHADNLRWLTDIRQGDQNIIDMVFCGAEWHDEAYALKRCAIPDGDREALHDLDVQHNLRLTSFALDQAMQAQSAAERPRWSLAEFFKQKSQTQALPNHLFQATQADEAIIKWLAKNASQVVEDKNLAIANWILLSLHRPLPKGYQGGREQDLEKMLNTLLGPKGLKSLGLERADAARIRAFARQGFSSVSAVVACRRQIEAFADGLRQAAGLRQMDESRDPRVKADRIARELFEKLTGVATNAPDGDELSARMRAHLKSLVPPGRAALEAQIAMNRDVAAKIRSEYGNVQDPSSFHEKLVKQRDRCLKQMEALAGFTDKNETQVLAQKEQLKAQLKRLTDDIEAMDRLIEAEGACDELTRQVPLARGEEAYFNAARDLAILQEARNHPPGDFQPGKHAGAIMARLRAFGLDPANRNPHVVAIHQRLASELTKDKRTLEKLCNDLDPNTMGKRMLRGVGGARPAKPTGEQVLVSAAEKQRLENRAVIRRNFEQLKANQSFSIHFGTYGEVSVTGTVLPGANVGSSTRIEKSNSIRFSREADGRYSVSLLQGGSVRHGVSVATLGEVINLGAYLQSGRSSGHELAFPDQRSCEAFAMGLVSGEVLDPALWDEAVVRRTGASSRGAGASAAASLDLGAASASVEARVDGQIGHKTRTADGLQEDEFTLELSATATAAVQSAGEVAGKDVGVGMGLALRKTVTRQFGVLAGASLVAAVPVTGGKLEGALRTALPAEMRDQADEWLKKLEGEAGLDEGELFVRYKMTEKAFLQAKAESGKASKAVFDALLTVDPVQRDELHAQARMHMDEAMAITRSPGNYVPEGLGWITKELVEVTQSRGLYTNFSRGESLESGFLRFEAAKGTPPPRIP